MMPRPTILPVLAAVLLLLLLPLGCGKKLPTYFDAGQGFQRTVLVEVFTSEFCSNCPKADAAAEQIAAEMGDSLCLIELHPVTFQSSGDSLGLVETDVLAAGYESGLAVKGLPLLTCDGLKPPMLGTAADIPETYRQYREQIDVRKLIRSPLQINVSAQLDLSAIRYTATIHSDVSLPSSPNLGLVLVVVEDSVNAYGRRNRYVARKLYPSIKGDSLHLSGSSTIRRSGSIPTVSGWLPYRLTLVAYVRDNTTNEILQSSKVRIIAATTPPDAPVLDSPANGAAELSLSPTLSWNASSGAVSYTLHVSADSLFNSVFHYPGGLTNTSQTVVNPAIQNAATYYWRVSASNSAGTSAWSAVRSFTTTATLLLPKPTLIFPANGAGGISTSPTLVWSAGSGAGGYSLQVATTNAFSNIVYAIAGLTDTVKAISGLANAATYYWRVNAVNAAGPSPWSEVWSFATTAATPPAAPTLSAPPNGEVDAGSSPALTWNPSSGAESYRLQVSTSGSFSNLVYDQSGISGTSRIVNGLPSLTTYHWRVNAANAGGASGWSDVWSFTDARGFSFSRLTTVDPALQAPDSVIEYSLANPPSETGFHVYITNLTAVQISISGQSDTMLNSSPSLFYGQICTEGQCLGPNGVGDEDFDTAATHHWTIHFKFNTSPPPFGLHYLTLALWDKANPGSVMGCKLYVNVIP